MRDFSSNDARRFYGVRTRQCFLSELAKMIHAFVIFVVLCFVVLCPSKSFAGGTWEIRVLVVPGGMDGNLDGDIVANQASVSGSGGVSLSNFAGSHPFFAPLTVDNTGKFSLRFDTSAFAMHQYALPYTDAPSFASASISGTFKVFFIWKPENDDLSADPAPSTVVVRGQSSWATKPLGDVGFWENDDWLPPGRKYIAIVFGKSIDRALEWPGS